MKFIEQSIPQPTIPNDTTVEVSKMTLPAGKWLIFISGMWNNLNSLDGIRSIALDIRAEGQSLSGKNPYELYTGTTDSAQTNMLNQHYFYPGHFTVNGDVSFLGYQNSGVDTPLTWISFKAIKIGS